tara:strand:+ start:130 stop:309 length:180 start_codon:yes stop_codon:yes gene_type:complete
LLKVGDLVKVKKDYGYNALPTGSTRFEGVWLLIKIDDWRADIRKGSNEGWVPLDQLEKV